MNQIIFIPQPQKEREFIVKNGKKYYEEDEPITNREAGIVIYTILAIAMYLFFLFWLQEQYDPYGMVLIFAGIMIPVAIVGTIAYFSKD